MSYPGIAQCRKCGHALQSGQAEENPPEVLGDSTPTNASAAEDRDLPLSEEVPSDETITEAIPLVEVPINTPADSNAEIPPPEALPLPSEPPQPAWREELSQRVENFRRRRARIRGQGESSSNLEFDFEEPKPPPVIPPAEILPEEPVIVNQGLDVDLGGLPDSRLQRDERNAVEPEQIGAAEEQLEPSPTQHFEHELDLPAPDRPAEFVLVSEPFDPSTVAAEPFPPLRLAPMHLRFIGGLIDATVLLAAAGVFALIFWWAGGHMSVHPLNLVVVGFLAVFLILAYFGIFTALISTTPGLLWLDIEVRSLQGGSPTPRQSFWRAFGYLVSISSLLLGFVWALFDHDGLTWHDRMSATFLTRGEGMEPRRGSRADI